MDPRTAEKPGPLCVTPEMVSVASPLFETVKLNVPVVVPTFARPKSCDAGLTLITGPLTAAARTAALEASTPAKSCPCSAAEAIPGANARAKSPSRTIKNAEVRIAVLPQTDEPHEIRDEPMEQRSTERRHFLRSIPENDSQRQHHEGRAHGTPRQNSRVCGRHRGVRASQKLGCALPVLHEPTSKRRPEPLDSSFQPSEIDDERVLTSSRS